MKRPSPLRARCSQPWRASRNGLVSRIASSPSQRSSGNSATGATCWKPALGTIASRRPKCSIAASTAPRLPSRVVRSAAWATPGPSSAGSRSTASTSKPSSTRRSAIARPMPLPAPVTIALRPAMAPGVPVPAGLLRAMGVTERERLAPEVFRLPVEKIREGYYSDVYFNFAKATLELDDRHPRVLMQVFQRKGAGRRRPDGSWEDGWDQLEVAALHEGDEIEPFETVMTIEGDYALFAHLETVYLGCMARRTLIMRNVREVVDAAGGKPIIYFPARHDHWLVQTGDGWAAHVAGAIGVSTDPQASWWGGRGIGTVPHGLIAAYGGDTVAAARAFSRFFGDQMNVTVL